MARHAPVPPFPEDAEVADLLRKIGWQATKADLAEIEKQQATRERAKLVYDSSNRSAFDAAVEAHHARVTAAILAARPHEDDAPPIREEFEARHRAAQEAMRKMTVAAMPTVQRMLESAIVATATAMGEAKGAVTPLGIQIGPEVERAALHRTLGKLVERHKDMTENPSGSEFRSVYELAFFALPK